MRLILGGHIIAVLAYGEVTRWGDCISAPHHASTERLLCTYTMVASFYRGNDTLSLCAETTGSLQRSVSKKKEKEEDLVEYRMVKDVSSIHQH